MMEHTSLFDQLKAKFGGLSPAVKRYLVIGISVYLFELLVIVVARQAGFGSVAAVGLSFWAGLVLSFGLQKIVTFGDRRLHHRVLIPQLAAFAALVMFNFGFTLALTKLLEDIVPATICRTVALGITTIWNFYLYKTRIFKPAKADKLAVKVRAVPFSKRYARWARQPEVAGAYVATGMLLLVVSTLLWSYLGAKLNLNNADQLVNAYLFQSGAVWHGAQLPDQHSFLIKWPLFYMVKLLGYTSVGFIVLTMTSALLTVGLFVFVLSRIEKRPYVLGTLCLALSSVLLMVPPQPYAGGLLPVNMAMLATRNLEYMVFTAALYFIIRAPRLRSKQFGVAVVLLGLLIASDKLFLSVGVAGAALALLCYGLRKRWKLVNVSARWLAGGLVAGLAAVVLLHLLNAVGVVHIVSQPLAGPYGLVHDAASFALAVLYALGGLLTNFGANPAYDALTVGAIPSRIVHNLFSAGGFAYLVNLACFMLGAVLSLRLIAGSLNLTKAKAPRALYENVSGRLALLLLWASVAAGGLFVLSNHYYAVDARYLTLALFALFITAAAWARTKKKLPQERLLAVGLVILVSIASGSLSAISTYNHQSEAYAGINQRNDAIAQALRSHRVDVLVGDYWRVLPVHAAMPDQPVFPLQSCTEPRTTLTSRNWQQDLRSQSFAYLLTLRGSLTDYPDCDLQQISLKYGLPNSSTLIAGNVTRPDELLLFYDHGSHGAASQLVTKSEAEAAVVPIGLNRLPQVDCPKGQTVVNVVAHQDDDLLFMNPDVSRDIQAGNCVRTVYLTAGDAGADAQYWLAREQGSQAAYGEMLGGRPVWTQRIIQLPSGQFVTIATPRGHETISLIFMRLPDGNLHGDGFAGSHHESLAALEAGKLRRMQSVDRQSVYTAKQLTDGLKALLDVYSPITVRAQSNFVGTDFPDHSDHRAAGRFADRAFRQYAIDQYGDTVPPALLMYMGYPVRELLANVEEPDLSAKEAAFAAYGAFDPGVCRTVTQCKNTDTYGSYLSRQYQNPF